MTNFGDQLSALCAKATADAHGKPDLMGEIIERLLNSTAFAIAIASGGERERMDNMLTGAEGYLVETAIGYMKVAAFMSSTSGRRM
jgi:hypothetical protein